MWISVNDNINDWAPHRNYFQLLSSSTDTLWCRACCLYTVLAVTSIKLQFWCYLFLSGFHLKYKIICWSYISSNLHVQDISSSTQSSVILRLRAQYPKIWGLGMLIELKKNGQTSEGMSLWLSPGSTGFSFLYPGHKNEKVPTLLQTSLMAEWMKCAISHPHQLHI